MQYIPLLVDDQMMFRNPPPAYPEVSGNQQQFQPSTTIPDRPRYNKVLNEIIYCYNVKLYIKHNIKWCT